jgi:hypothetical protein
LILRTLTFFDFSHATFRAIRSFDVIFRQVLAKIRPELDKSGIDAHGVDDVLHDLEKVRASSQREKFEEEKI